MRRAVFLLSAVVVGMALGVAPAAAHFPAQGNFGVHGFDVTFTDKNGEIATQAGSHPFALTTTFFANRDAKDVPEGWFRDLSLEQITGLLGDTTAYPSCTTLQFLAIEEGLSSCPPDSQLGITAIEANELNLWASRPIYNVAPPPGVLLRLGFSVHETSVVLDVGLNPNPPYNPTARARNISQLIEFMGSKTQLWGDPSDPAHDSLRGLCGIEEGFLGPGEEFEFEGSGSCKLNKSNPKPFLTLPTNCAQPLHTSYDALSWEGDRDAGSVLTHDAEGSPQPFTGCGALPPFNPSISVRPTSRAASSPTGLDFTLGVDDQGLTSLGPAGAQHYQTRAQSLIRKAIVTLPEGMTANPSVAEGLEVCSEADLARETLESGPGDGCPEASKIGTIEVDSPLIDTTVKGSLYEAKPYANLADDALIAFYIVLRNPALGVMVKQPVRVEADPRTGQLQAVADEIPQLAFGEFRLKFREGGRSPLASPPGCGIHTVTAQLYPWSGQAPITDSSSFQIISGPDGSPCPTGRPFEPGFHAGSENNSAGHHSPFSMRLTRRDGDQDLTRFDATLPPGVSAKLAGVDRCPEAQIALAKTKTGTAELRSPACPANSKIGTIEAGAGVGSQLTYVKGSLYLAGRFGGAPLSAVAIVPAVAGPFDVGTVVTREALQVNPRTGQVTADGAHSDPIPHILAGIPLLVRDIQVHVDRPDFTLNPTSCDSFATQASIWGGGTNLFSTLDDSPVQRQARYQAASCLSLFFKPVLALRLKGGHRRASFPALRMTYTAPAGGANLKRLTLRLPHSEFIEQGHFRTICTRVQFAAGSGHGAECPAGSVYGHARVFTPLLSEPLEGPVLLRSSNHNLPDAVLSLHGLIDVEAVARIDSVHGRLRATLEGAPDAPVSKAVVKMRGGQKGLFVNSTDLCTIKHRANVDFLAQNNKRLARRPLMRIGCGAGHRKHQRRRRAR